MYNKANQYNSWISPKEKSGFRCMQIWRKRKNAQLTRSVNPGFGVCSQRAGAELAQVRTRTCLPICKALTGLPCLSGTRTVKGCIARLKKMDGNALLAKYHREFFLSGGTRIRRACSSAFLPADPAAGDPYEKRKKGSAPWRPDPAGSGRHGALLRAWPRPEGTRRRQYSYL